MVGLRGCRGGVYTRRGDTVWQATFLQYKDR